MTARHVLRATRRRPSWEYIVVGVVCTAMGALAVSAVKPQTIDRPYSVPAVTVTEIVTWTRTPTPSPTPSPTPTRKKTP